MAWDNKKAASSDDLKYALDYDQVTQRISGLLESTHFELVEALAETVAKMIMDEFSVSGVRIKLSKLDAIATTQGVGVSISRGISF